MMNDRSRRLGRLAAMLAGALALASVALSQVKPDPAQKFPDVLKVNVQAKGGNRFDFDVTISSPYDTPARYADAFRVMNRAGTVFGERVLVHDHADEQPFTRDLHGVLIPPDQREVIVQARDKQFGYGGKTVTTPLPGR